jgi:hypothetical protein
MLHNRMLGRLLILMVPAALFVYLSTRPHVRLRADMPPQFVDIPASAGPKQRETEERLARDYWNCALTVIQWKYTHVLQLPDSPPEQFWASTQLPPGSEPISSSRVRYWHRLQRVWLQPSSWVTSQTWSTDWLTKPIARTLNRFENYFRELIQGG